MQKIGHHVSESVGVLLVLKTKACFQEQRSVNKDEEMNQTKTSRCSERYTFSLSGSDLVSRP